jgi:hypothetical protein
VFLILSAWRTLIRTRSAVKRSCVEAEAFRQTRAQAIFDLFTIHAATMISR